MKTLRIFNFTQANFLYKNGCEIINLGYSYENKKPYVKFVSDDKLNEVMKIWQNNKRK